jgi:hypothetical protein
MPFAYVTLSPSLDASARCLSTRVYALLLPSRDDSWPEITVRHSALEGFGVCPAAPKGTKASKAEGLTWTELSTPVLLPYLGAETVTKDAHTQRQLLMVLKGRFEQLTVAELSVANNSASYVADGLFAVPSAGASTGTSPLPPSTELLQVCDGPLSSSAAGPNAAPCCYMLAEEVRVALHLHGPRRHLFDLLCAHGRHEHVDRHLATHVATLHRKEEGYVLINAHPAFLDGIGVVGMINEPAKDEHANLKMVQGYARLLVDGDPLLRNLGLTQPKGAAQAWARSILPPEGGGEGGTAASGPGSVSERMVLYATTRKAYELGKELTVDYGRSYARDYASGAHKPNVRSLPTAAAIAQKVGTGSAAAQPIMSSWPQIPGWFNPAQQPASRPAFRLDATTGAAALVPDDPAVVRANREAAGLPPALGVSTSASPSKAASALDKARASSPRAQAFARVVSATSPATVHKARTSGGDDGYGSGGTTPKHKGKRQRPSADGTPATALTDFFFAAKRLRPR